MTDTQFKTCYTFDDVALVPQYNNVDSRLETDVSVWITQHVKSQMPIIPANMDTVIGPTLGNIIVKNGGIVIIHRFQPFEQQLEQVKLWPNKCFVSIGIMCNMNEIHELYLNGALGVCIDIAHGHSESVIQLIQNLRKEFPFDIQQPFEIIAGNVCTVQGYIDLVNAGANAVKVGVGPGAVCTTRVVTGFGIPQFSAIYEIGRIAKKRKVPIIADGGIRNTKDMNLALAAGASSVMIGSLFAKTLESAAPKFIKIKIDQDDQKETNYMPLNINSAIVDNAINSDLDFSRLYVRYRGQASQEFQQEYYGQMKSGTVAEGVASYFKCNTRAQNIIDEFLGALRSSMTYGGSRTIKEFQNKAEFVLVTNNYIVESKPRLE